MRGFWAAAATAAVLAVGAAGPSSAKILNYTFQVSGNLVNPQDDPPTGERAFGIEGNPVLTGSFVVDTSFGTSNAVREFNFVTGTKTWSTADLYYGDGYYTYVTYTSGGDVRTVAIRAFGSGVENLSISLEGALYTGHGDLYWPATGHLYLTETAQLQLFCSSCVFPSPALGTDLIFGIPEPSTWLMMIAGFGAAGAMLRRGKGDCRTLA